MIDPWSLVIPHRQRLLVVARRRLASPADAEDVVSEAMLRVATHPGLDPARVGAMLTSVVVRLCADEGRRRGVESGNLARLVSVPSDPLADVDDTAEARYLSTVRLTKAEAAVLRARMFGMFPREVAAGLGMSVSGARHALERARRKIVAAWKATLGILGLSWLRRLAPVSGAVMLAALVLTLADRPPPAVQEEPVAGKASAGLLDLPRTPLPPSLGVVLASEREHPVPMPVASSPSATVVRVPGVRGEGFAVGDQVVVVDTSRATVAHVVRCVKGGVEVWPESGSVTCRT